MQEERKEAIKHVVGLYKELLGDTLDVTDTFDLSRLPKPVQLATELVIAKAPGFATVSAVTVGNYVTTHLLSQLRPSINDIAYSNDVLGLNYYGINFSTSGSGKDSSFHTLTRACKGAFQLVEKEVERVEIERAKQLAFRELVQEDPNITIGSIAPEIYEGFMREVPPILADGASTRNGLITTINDIADREYSNLSVFMPEFGISLKNGSNTADVLELLTILYDTGTSTVSAYKTKELRQKSINGMYPNALLHSSPKIVFGNKQVAETLSNLFSTALARRSWLTMPEEVESTENNPVPKTPEEARDIVSNRRLTIATNSVELGELTEVVVTNMLASPENRIVRFSEEAQVLYTDYFEYNAKSAELLEDSSLMQIELNGRAFKVARLAAIWSLLEHSNEVSEDTLKSAIYFAQYLERYLKKFVILTSSKAYRLMGDLFKSGKIVDMPLDTAITNGYVSRVSAINELLEAINSYLRTSGIVTYDVASKLFSYSAFKKVEETGDYGISYTKVPGLSKHDRTDKLNSFEQYRLCNMSQLVKMVSSDTIYNVFKYDTVDGVSMKRSQSSIISNSKLLSIDVDKSFLTIEQMHDFLGDFKHVIATTSDSSNKHKYRILLPVNIEIEGDKPDMYRCIVRSVSEALTIDYDPTSANNSLPMFGYSGAEVFSNNEGDLYDISEIISDCANDHAEGVKVINRPTTPAAIKKAVDDIMANANKVFDYVISCPKGTGSLSMARASLHMRDTGFTKEQYVQVIKYLNSCWQSSMPEERIEGIINQFSDQMR